MSKPTCTGLSAALAVRIETVYQQIRPHIGITLEQFEVAFMREPDRHEEVALWEQIAHDYEQTVAGCPDRTAQDQRRIYNAIVQHYLD